MGYATAVQTGRPVVPSAVPNPPNVIVQQQQHENIADKERIYSLVLELTNVDKRESALLELSKKREQ